MWICFIYTIKERCKLCGYVLYIQLRKGVSCVVVYIYTIKERCKLCGYVLYMQFCVICFIYTIKERCKLCGYVLYIQLRKGVSCVDMFYIYN